jgi:hypothetical protein
MADIVTSNKMQSLAEVRQWDFDFSNDMPAGATIESVEATHIPPSGSAATPMVGEINGNAVPVQLGPLTVIGWHELVALATYSNGEISELRVKIPVKF